MVPDFEEFLQNPNREWDYIEDELVEQNKNSLQELHFIRDNVYGREQLSDIKSALFFFKRARKGI